MHGHYQKAKAAAWAGEDGEARESGAAAPTAALTNINFVYKHSLGFGFGFG